jgi:hypothetical protein
MLDNVGEPLNRSASWIIGSAEETTKMLRIASNRVGGRAASCAEILDKGVGLLLGIRQLMACPHGL